MTPLFYPRRICGYFTYSI